MKSSIIKRIFVLLCQQVNNFGKVESVSNPVDWNEPSGS